MSERADELLSLNVPCDRTAPAIVRDALGRLEALRQIRSDVMLVASELVTNAVRHSGCLGEDRLSISARLAEDRLVISVHDPGFLRQSAERRQPAEREAGGWGLTIVEELASRWGAVREDGYRVWAELSLV